MAEQRLSELVEHLIDWIESLHEKNLKYQAQVKTLSRDLAKAQNSNEQLEARLSAYQNVSDIKQSTVIATNQVPQVTDHLATNHMSNLHDSNGQITQSELHTQTLNHLHHDHLQQSITTSQQHQLQHPQQQQQQAPIYAQQMHNPQTFVPQPQYVWTTYDTSGQVPYYSDQYSGAPAVGASAAFQQPQ